MAKWSFSVHGVTRIITSNIYTRLAACNCISITFWSGDLPSPLMAIFYDVNNSLNGKQSIFKYTLLFYLRTKCVIILLFNCILLFSIQSC